MKTMKRKEQSWYGHCNHSEFSGKANTLGKGAVCVWGEHVDQFISLTGDFHIWSATREKAYHLVTIWWPLNYNTGREEPTGQGPSWMMGTLPDLWGSFRLGAGCKLVKTRIRRLAVGEFQLFLQRRSWQLAKQQAPQHKKRNYKETREENNPKTGIRVLECSRFLRLPTTENWLLSPPTFPHLPFSSSIRKGIAHY